MAVFKVLFCFFPVGITSSATELKTCVITAGIKKYTSMINEKKKKHNKKVLLAESELDSLEFLISKALFESNIRHDEFILINNVLKEYDDIKKK